MTKTQNSLSLDEVKHMARLANLPLTEEEIVKYTRQISSILDLVSELQKVKTEKVPPTSQVTGLTNIFREDEVDTSRILTQKEALSNAKKQRNGYFVVPAVLR